MSEGTVHPCAPKATSKVVVSAVEFAPPFTFSAPSQPDFTLSGILMEQLAPETVEAKRRQHIKDVLRSDPSRHFTLLRQNKRDRYGRQAAFVSPSNQSTDQKWNQDAPSLQETLLEKGLGRLDTRSISPECADHLTAIEMKARLAKRGLWKHATYEVKNADALHLSAILSTYQIIYGKVLSVSRNPNGTSYLNFGRHWKSDFTITLNKKSLQAWESQYKFLDELVNAPIYVRGWIEEKGGPLIRVSEPNQMWIAADQTE